MGGIVGYEYHYSFRMEDEIIPLYELRLSRGIKSFLFEIRTNFIVKKTNDEDVIIGSERFDACVQEDEGNLGMDMFFRYRLEDYWMTHDEVCRFVDEAYDFAKQMAADPLHASLTVIPIVVDLEVCTVQQENESLSATMERAISEERLLPLYLWPYPTVGRNKPVDLSLVRFMLSILRISVENVDEGLGLMQVCLICSRNASIGTHISVLQCQHAFHSHCLIQGLEKSELCLVCNSAVHPA